MRVHAAVLTLTLTAGCNVGGNVSQAESGPAGLLQALWCKVGTCSVAERLDFHIPAVIHSSTQELAIAPTVTNPRGETLNGFPVKLEVEPAAVAVVTQAQGLRCVSSGEAVLLGAAGPATHSERFRCQLVGRIEVAPHLRVVLGGGAVDPAISIFGTDGHEIRGLAPSFSIADEQVLREEEGKLIPVGVGVSRVTVQAGDRSTNTLVTVVRQLKNEPLLLNDGHRINYALPHGNYEVIVRVRSGNTGHGVTLTWVGGDGCVNQPESQDFTSRCRIDSSGALIVENPTTFGLGPAADGVISIYEAP